MTGTLTIPTIGQPNSTEDVDIRDALNTLNGLLTASNLLDGAQIGATTIASGSLASNAVTTAKITDANVTDAKLASPNNSVYRTLLTGSGAYPASSSGTRYFVGDNATGGGNLVQTPGINGYGQLLIYIDTADFAVSGLTSKLRIRAQQATATTGPGTTLTVGLYPVTAIATSAFTVGTVTSGSTVAFASTASNTLTQGNSGDFTFTTGYYIVGVANSGTTAASSGHDLYFQLQYRAV